MAKGGSSTTQTQQVSTNVSVTNVIEDRGLEPLERLKLLTDALGTIDQTEIARQSAGQPGTVILQPQVQQSPFDFLQNPQTVIVLASVVAGLILIAKRVR